MKLWLGAFLALVAADLPRQPTEKELDLSERRCQVTCRIEDGKITNQKAIIRLSEKLGERATDSVAKVHELEVLIKHAEDRGKEVHTMYLAAHAAAQDMVRTARSAVEKTHARNAEVKSQALQDQSIFWETEAGSLMNNLKEAKQNADFALHKRKKAKGMKEAMIKKRRLDSRRLLVATRLVRRAALTNLSIHKQVNLTEATLKCTSRRFKVSAAKDGALAKQAMDLRRRVHKLQHKVVEGRDSRRVAQKRLCAKRRKLIYGEAKLKALRKVQRHAELEYRLAKVRGEAAQVFLESILSQQAKASELDGDVALQTDERAKHNAAHVVSEMHEASTRVEKATQAAQAQKMKVMAFDDAMHRAMDQKKLRDMYLKKIAERLTTESEKLEDAKNCRDRNLMQTRHFEDFAKEAEVKADKVKFRASLVNVMTEASVCLANCRAQAPHLRKSCRLDCADKADKFQSLLQTRVSKWQEPVDQQCMAKCMAHDLMAVTSKEDV